jgi:transcriptional regulator of acetoin/glycerol metabolism
VALGSAVEVGMGVAAELAREFGIHRTTVWRNIQALGIKKRFP